jgi:hypothetical protein
VISPWRPSRASATYPTGRTPYRSTTAAGFRASSLIPRFDGGCATRPDSRARNRGLHCRLSVCQRKDRSDPGGTSAMRVPSCSTLEHGFCIFVF